MGILNYYLYLVSKTGLLPSSNIYHYTTVIAQIVNPKMGNHFIILQDNSTQDIPVASK